MSSRHVHWSPTASRVDTDLFTLPVPAARQSDPDTSHIAAASMVEGASRHAQLVLSALKTLGPATYTELATATGLAPVQVNRRLHELRRARLVERLPETRLTPSGRPARLHCLTRGNPS